MRQSARDIFRFAFRNFPLIGRLPVAPAGFWLGNLHEKVTIKAGFTPP